MSALDIQEGGSHYKSFAIQPIEYCKKNKLGAIESNIIKHATRHKLKNGADDIKKLIHYAQLLLEFDYNIQSVVGYPPNISADDLPQYIPNSLKDQKPIA